MTPLDPSTIAALLKPSQLATPNPQIGPLRYYDKEMRCARRRCTSPTFVKVRGIPRCMTHALEDLNTIIVESSVEGG